MPGKGRRVASRQAQLGQRRRRHNRGPSGAPPSPPQPEAPQREAATNNVATQVQQPAPPPQRSESATPSRSPVATAQARSVPGRSDRAAAYNYVMPELRRILMLAGVLTVVLVVLAFFV